MSRLTAALLVALAITGCSFDASSVPGSSGAAVPEITPPNQNPLQECGGVCHGEPTNPAPPLDTMDRNGTELRSVGAHRAHLQDPSQWHRVVVCTDCHQNAGMPPNHDNDIVEVEFSDLARSKVPTPPRWDPATETCSNVYCHGASLEQGASGGGAGSAKVPRWTLVDGSQIECGSCHGAPPPLPHPQATNCSQCHPTVLPGDNPREFNYPDSHINGVVDTLPAQEQPCDTCHGQNDEPSPPLALDRGDPAQRADRSFYGVGAHREHLQPSSWHLTFDCTQCHRFPTSVNSPGHRDQEMPPRAEVTMAQGLSSEGVYNQTNATCANLWCHSDGYSALGSGTWTDVADLLCGSCHDDGTRSGRRALSGAHQRHRNLQPPIPCRDCHTEVLANDGKYEALDINSIQVAARHIDGLLTTGFAMPTAWSPGARECTSACHDEPTDKYSWSSGGND